MRRNASKVGAHATRYDASALDANADDVDVARERDGSSTEDVVLCFTQAMFVRTIAVVRFGEKDGGGEERMMAKERERACAYRSVEEFERACASVGEKVDVRKEGTYIGKDLTRNARAVYAMRATSRAMEDAFVSGLPSDADVDARSVKGATAKTLNASDAALVANAAAVVTWREKTKFCRECGHGLTMIRGGRVGKCEKCGAKARQELSPACLSLITCGNYVLLGRNAKWPQGFYSLLAGFVEPSETLERCVAREAFEEASIEVKRSSIEYVASQPWPFPNQLMLGFRAAVDPVRLGPLKMPPVPKLRDSELCDARWFHVDYLASRLAPDRAFADPRDGAEDIPFGEIALPGEHALARRLVQGWLDEKLSLRRRRCDDRLVTTVVEGSFFTECELSSGDDAEENGGANFIENEKGEYNSLNFVMVEVLLAQEGQAPVVIRAAPVDVAVIHKQVVAEVERVGEGARAIAYVRATGRVKCKKESSGAQSIYVQMLSEASDDGFDARAIVVAMLQKACPFHEFYFSS